MSYYGGTVTVTGRNMLASLLKGGSIKLTRVVVGKGRLEEGVVPLDQTSLVEEVAQGTSTPPIVRDGAVTLTVEYRNDMNEGLKEGFWLSEFGIYAKTDTMPEGLFYYATLGDSPQPVSKYSDDRIDIRRYPLTIALEVDAEVRVLYDMNAFATSDNVLALVKDQVTRVLESGAVLPVNVMITIPHEGWQDTEREDPEGLEGQRFMEIPVAGITQDTLPMVALMPKSMQVAKKCGLWRTCLSKEGTLRVYAVRDPEEDIEASLTMYMSGIDLRGDWAHVDPESLVDWSLMPAATATSLGGVKIGRNVAVTSDGTISVKSADVIDTVKATPEHVEGMMDEVLGPEED